MRRFKEHYRLSAKPVGPVLNTLINKNLQQNGFVSADIAALWPQIVDPSLIGESHPFKMINTGSKHQSPNHRGQTLTVKCSQGAYLLLSYQKEQLINKLNQHLGFAAITDIKFIKTSKLAKTNTHINQNSKDTPNTKPPQQTSGQNPLDQALLKLKALQKR